MTCCFPRKTKKDSKVSQEPAFTPSKKTSYKFTYFNGRGRGEVTRMLFAVAQVPYEDVRIEFADWPAMKPKTPLGCLPLLEINGKSMESAQAINRYLARKFGLVGKTDFEQTRVDMISEVLLEIWSTLSTLILEPDEAIKKEGLGKVFGESGPKLMAYLEEVICRNYDGNSFFVGKSVTIADIWFITTMDYYLLPGMNENGLDKYPKLKALRQRVESHKQIAEWIAKRPQTPF